MLGEPCENDLYSWDNGYGYDEEATLVVTRLAGWPLYLRQPGTPVSPVGRCAVAPAASLTTLIFFAASKLTLEANKG